MIPIIKQWGGEVEIKIIKRGFAPTGGGLVKLTVQPLKYIKAQSFVKVGKYKKIR